MNIFNSALLPIKQAAKCIDLPDNFIKKLFCPDRIIKVDFPLEHDNGQIEIIKGLRVQYNNLLGPYKGGLRFHSKVNLDEVQTLAFWMMIKNAIVNIPFGGGKGGICIDPNQLSKKELERLTREFTRRIAPNIGPFVDVPAPDVNTNCHIMDWIADEYIKQFTIKYKHSKYEENALKAVVTGKSLKNGGSIGREQATGLGGFYILEQFIKKITVKKPLTVAIQGFGNVGSNIAKVLYDQNYQIVAISDVNGGILNHNGLNIDKLIKCREEKKQLSDPGGEIITNEQLLELSVDILIPAALENVITEKNVSNIKAKVILEMANGPTSYLASQTLNQKGVVIIPDVLANSGGVTVSYFEWYQNICNERWPLIKVNMKLKEKMEEAFSKVWQIHKEKKVSLKVAAYILALKRLSKKVNLEDFFDPQGNFQRQSTYYQSS